MKLRRRQELAAMNALFQKGIAKEDVQSLKVDGEVVDLEDVARRESLLNEKRAVQQDRIEHPNLFGRAMERLESRADGFESTIGKLKYGDRILSMMSKET